MPDTMINPAEAFSRDLRKEAKALFLSTSDPEPDRSLLTLPSDVGSPVEVAQNRQSEQGLGQIVQFSTIMARLEIEINDHEAMLEPLVTLYVGKQKQTLCESNYLTHIWRHGLDTSCMVCNQNFDIDNRPPVRTFAIETSHNMEAETADTRTSPYAVRIFNRHLDCIQQEKVDYIPVSHAWHDVISSSQQKEVETLDATRLAYNTSMRTLLALKQKYGNIEIWHDYMSVPQWHKEIHQQLLLAIPSIYSYPKMMVMHLDDVRIQSLDHVNKGVDYSDYMNAVAKLTRSRWFSRMWVTLEYIQGREVQVLTEDFKVFELSAKELCHQVEQNNADFTARSGVDKFSADCRFWGYRWDQAISWMDTELWKEEVGSHTFGSAVYILGQKSCRDASDQYFGLRAMLGLRQDKSEVATIMSGDNFGSYMSIAWQSLKSGDYTPLLLTPPPEETIEPRPSWLRGYSQFTPNVWNLGACRQKARHPTIIRDGELKPELEKVGCLEDFEYYDFKESKPELVLCHVAKHIFNSTGTNARQFCATIDRVLPAVSKKGQYVTLEDLDQPPERLVLGYDYEHLNGMLEDLDTIVGNPYIPERELLNVLQKLMKALQLDKREDETKLSRIEAAAAEAEWYRRPD